jgi:hypothetical protein
MHGLPLEPVTRLRRAHFPSEFTWRFASVADTLLSVTLIALTVSYRLRGIQLPPALPVALLAAFATVVLLFSKFLFWVQRQEGSATMVASHLLHRSSSHRHR